MNFRIFVSIFSVVIVAVLLTSCTSSIPKGIWELRMTQFLDNKLGSFNFVTLIPLTFNEDGSFSGEGKINGKWSVSTRYKNIYLDPAKYSGTLSIEGKILKSGLDIDDINLHLTLESSAPSLQNKTFKSVVARLNADWTYAESFEYEDAKANIALEDGARSSFRDWNLFLHKVDTSP